MWLFVQSKRVSGRHIGPLLCVSLRSLLGREKDVYTSFSLSLSLSFSFLPSFQFVRSDAFTHRQVLFCNHTLLSLCYIKVQLKILLPNSEEEERNAQALFSSNDETKEDEARNDGDEQRRETETSTTSNHAGRERRFSREIEGKRDARVRVDLFFGFLGVWSAILLLPCFPLLSVTGLEPFGMPSSVAALSLLVNAMFGTGKE